MLHYRAIESATLELLNKLMKVPAFSNLRLVGGTSLALQIGHRFSVDIDLFGKIEADEFEISDELNKLGKVTVLNKTKNINIFLINNIKVDIVNYHYPWLNKAVTEKNLKLAGLKDIAALKLAAITGRGAKKDFIDIWYLFNYFSLKEMLGFYRQKFSDASEIIILKSLIYFEDANADEEPVLFKKINWENIKNKIIKSVDLYIKSR